MCDGGARQRKAGGAAQWEIERAGAKVETAWAGRDGRLSDG